MDRKKVTAPWMPTEYELADLKAVQSVILGEANAEQQQRAMKWIIEKVCGTYDMSYHPNSARDSDFAEGKRFVGLQIVKALRVNTAVLARRK